MPDEREVLQNLLGEAQAARSKLNEIESRIRELEEGLGEAASKATAKARELSSTLDKVRSSIDDVGRSSQRITGQMQQSTAAIEKQAESARKVERNISDLGKSYNEFGNVTQSVNESLRRDNIWEQIARGARGAQRLLENLNQTVVQHRRAIVDATTAMGIYGRYTGDIISGNEKLTVSYSQVTDAINTMAQSGRITLQEAQTTYTRFAESGINVLNTMQLLSNPASGALGLVNSGFLKLDEVTQLATVAMNELGSSVQSTEGMLLRIADSATRVNEEFGGSVLSTHQLAREVLTLQQSFRFLSTDVETLPGTIAAFAQAAESVRRATGRGVTGRVAAELGRQYAQNVSQFGLENRVFFGQMAGMGQGIAAGEQFRMTLQERPGEALANVIQQIQRISGTRILGQEDYSLALGRGGMQAEAVAQQRAMQSQLIQQFMGGNEQQAMAFLDLMGNEEAQQRMLETMRETSKDPLDKIGEYLKQSEVTNKYHLQTSRELVEEFQKGLTLHAESRDYLGAVQGLLSYGPIVLQLSAMTAQLAAIYTSMRFNAAMAPGGPSGSGGFGFGETVSPLGPTGPGTRPPRGGPRGFLGRAATTLGKGAAATGRGIMATGRGMGGFFGLGGMALAGYGLSQLQDWWEGGGLSDEEISGLLGEAQTMQGAEGYTSAMQKSRSQRGLGSALVGDVSTDLMYGSIPVAAVKAFGGGSLKAGLGTTGGALTAGAALTAVQIQLLHTFLEEKRREGRVEGAAKSLEANLSIGQNVRRREEADIVSRLNEDAEKLQSQRMAAGTGATRAAFTVESSEARRAAEAISLSLSRLVSARSTALQLSNVMGEESGNEEDIAQLAQLSLQFQSIHERISQFGDIAQFIAANGFERLNDNQLQGLYSFLARQMSKIRQIWNRIKESARKKSATWITQRFGSPVRQIDQEISNLHDTVVTIQRAVEAVLRRRKGGQGLESDRLQYDLQENDLSREFANTEQAYSQAEARNIVKAASLEQRIRGYSRSDGTWITSKMVEEAREDVEIALKRKQGGGSPELRKAKIRDFERLQQYYRVQQNKMIGLLEGNGYSQEDAGRKVREIIGKATSSEDIERGLQAAIVEGRAIGEDGSRVSRGTSPVIKAATEAPSPPQKENILQESSKTAMARQPVRVDISLDGHILGTALTEVLVGGGHVAAGENSTTRMRLS